MGTTVIHVLVIEPYAPLRSALAGVKQAAGLDDVVIDTIEAATLSEALVILARFSPDVVITELSLRDDRADRSGMHVIRSAEARKIPVIVHTSQRPEDSIQTELALLHVPVLIKSVDSVVLMTIGVLLALKADKPATDVVDAFLRAARYLRALPGNIADNAKIILAVALEATVKEYEGNKAHASRLLGIERNFLRRMLRDWLPRPQHYLRLAGPEASEPRASETRLCADGLAKAAVPPTSTEKKRAQS